MPPRRRRHRPHRPRLPSTALLPLAVILGGAPAALGQDAEEAAERSPDAPFEIEDAFAAPRGEAEIGTSLRYRRGRSGPGRDIYELEPQVQFGTAWPRLELRASVAEAFGNSVEARQGGAVRLGVFQQLNAERRGGGVPVFGLLGAVALPYGPGGRGTETTLLAAASRFSTAALPFGVHANAAWFARLDPAPDERRHRWRLAFALSQAVRADTVLVASYVRESQERGERDLNLLRFGVRHRLADARTTLGLLVGTGIGRDSPRFEIGLGVVHSFSLGRDR